MAKNKNEEIEQPLEEEVQETILESESVSRESELEAALQVERDKYLRLAAEYDNFRKRNAKEREALFTQVRSDTIVKLLPVYDNIARALSQTCSDEAFYKGVELTMTQLKDILGNLGVTEIAAVGETFDPERHNAVMHIEDENVGENTVVEEFEKGFILGDKVIRFSTVKVAN